MPSTMQAATEGRTLVGAFAYAIMLGLLACSRTSSNTSAGDAALAHPPARADLLYRLTDASAPPPADGVYNSTPSWTPAGFVDGSGKRWLRLGARIKPSRLVLFAENNENTLFQLLVGHAQDSEGREGLLLGGTVVPASGW
jgi:hypothetical protein